MNKPKKRYTTVPSPFKSSKDSSEVISRQFSDYDKYHNFVNKGKDIQNRTDIGRNKDSEKYMSDNIRQGDVIIDIGSGLGNKDPRLAGVSVSELYRNPNIKRQASRIIATDVPSEVKTWEQNKKKSNIDYAEVSDQTFNTDVKSILRDKGLGDKKGVILRSANSIDLLMNGDQTLEHLNHLGKTLKDKRLTYIFNNKVLTKNEGDDKFSITADLNNRAFDHRGHSWTKNDGSPSYKKREIDAAKEVVKPATNISQNKPAEKSTTTSEQTVKDNKAREMLKLAYGTSNKPVDKPVVKQEIVKPPVVKPTTSTGKVTQAVQKPVEVLSKDAQGKGSSVFNKMVFPKPVEKQESFNGRSSKASPFLQGSIKDFGFQDVKPLALPVNNNSNNQQQPRDNMGNDKKPKYVTKNTPKLIGGVNTLVQKDGIYKQYPDGRKTYTKTGGKEQEVTSQGAMDAFDKLHPSFKPVGKKSAPEFNGLPSFDPGEEDINKFDPGEEEPLDNGVRYDRGTGPDPVTHTSQSGIPYSRQPDNNLGGRYLKKDGLTFKGYDKPVGGGSTGIGESYTERVPGGDLHIEKSPNRVVPTSTDTGTGLPEFDNKREFNPGRLTNIAYNMLTANSPVEFPKLGRFMPEAYQYADMSASKRKAITENRNYMTKAMQGSVNRGVSQGNLAGISAQHIGAMEAVNEGEAQRAMQLKLANVDMSNKAKEYNISKGDKEAEYQSQAEGLKHQAGQAAAVETSALAQATDIEKGMQRQDYNKYNMDKWVMENGLVGTDNYYYDANGKPQFRSTAARRYSKNPVNINVTPNTNTIKGVQ